MKPGMPRNSQISNNAEVPTAEKSAEFAAKHPSVGQRVLNSRQLFSAANEVLIEHAGLTYRLRITQANKLILTK